MESVLIKMSLLKHSGYVTFLKWFYWQNLNKQAYDLAKALLKRTAQAIEPYITNVSGFFFIFTATGFLLHHSVLFWILNKLLRVDRNLEWPRNDLKFFHTCRGIRVWNRGQSGTPGPRSSSLPPTGAGRGMMRWRSSQTLLQIHTRCGDLAMRIEKPAGQAEAGDCGRASSSQAF